MSQTLDGYLDVWERKPVLRLIYDDFYDRIVSACVPGITIEIGGGVGNLKRRLPHVITTDIQFAHWLDCVADAQHLPFAAGQLANIVMVDALHHIEFPVHFFREAARVLRQGGRIVMVEPAITVGSTLFYRLLHHEPVRMTADPLNEGTPDPRRDPYASNQAIPTLIATRDRQRFERSCPSLKVVRVNWFAFATYPLSGGFKRWSLMPQWVAPHALRLERAIESFLGRFGAFRMLLIVQKSC
jgi:SAM-dependent methyltransferase